MTDITMYSSEELSLICLNDQFYYNELQKAVRRQDFKYIQAVVNEDFIYTEEQMEDLEETFNNEVEEYNN